MVKNKYSYEEEDAWIEDPLDKVDDDDKEEAENDDPSAIDEPIKLEEGIEE